MNLLRSKVRGALVGYVILVAGVFGMYYNGQHVSGAEHDAVVRSSTAVAIDGCNRDFAQQEHFIDLLRRLRHGSQAAYKAGNVTPEQYALAQKFYASEIARAWSELPDCRKVVVTDAPGSSPAEPARYPGDRAATPGS